MRNFKATWHTSIKEIDKYAWSDLSKDNNPFYSWNWLSELEISDSINAKKGWQPLHLSLSIDQKIIGIAPLYLKNHSYGEFIFDQSFLKLANELGLNYYPKLIGMSPASPVEGYRFFISSKEDELEITTIMIKIIDNFAINNGILSCNFLYVDPIWSQLAEQVNCAKWLNKNSFWSANNQKTFADYLAGFNSNQRRNIKKERKSILNSGITITTSLGKEIDQKRMEKMHDLYELHCAKWGIWGSKYLSKSFFERLASPKYQDNLVLFNAHQGDSHEAFAMSLCITNKKKLWGRYWGSELEIENLHFELCYYTPISWAIDNGIDSFDPGAGGSHKLRRGFQLQSNISLHRWYNKKMDYIIRSWLPKANELMIQEIDDINKELPFKAKLTSM